MSYILFYLILLAWGALSPLFLGCLNWRANVWPDRSFLPTAQTIDTAPVYWHTYTSLDLGIVIRYPDGITAREWPGTVKGVEFVRQRDLGREIIPILLTIHEVGQRGDKPEECRQYFCAKTALLQEVHFNNAYGVRTFDYGYDYYLTDFSRRGKVLRIHLTNLVNSDDFEFVEIVTTLRFDRT